MTLVYLACTVAGYLAGLWLYREKPTYEVAQLSDVLNHYMEHDHPPPHYSELDADGLQFSGLQNDIAAYQRQAEGLRNMTPEERHAHENAMGIEGRL